MAVVGIVAEYNPFHVGHARHLALTREAAGEDPTLIVCMSGHWVQRGDCAVTDKWSRAAAAARFGADLVIELPTVYAMASAEPFARGAVELLTAAGIDTLSFGCETPDLPALQALANALNSPRFDTALAPFLARGLSYPAARQKAAEALVGAETAALLEKPNNNLAVEYIRSLPPKCTPLLVQRPGVHDDPVPDPVNPSAASLRALLRRGESANKYLPEPWSGPVYDLHHLERAILSRLRQMTVSELEAIPDSGDSLAQRLWKAAQTAATLDELWEKAKTRRLTHARLRRVTLRAFLPQTPVDANYLRVLAMTRRGAAHLASLRKSCPLPIIAKPARHKELLAFESALTDQFSLCAGQPTPCGEEFRHSPLILEDF